MNDNTSLNVSTPDRGLIAAYLLDGRGGARRLDWDGVAAWTPEQGLLWVHLQRDDANTAAWLERDDNVDPLIRAALLADESRPRVTPLGNGLLVFLRGVNLNPGANPEDMVSIRLWIEESRIISTRQRHLLSVTDLRAALDAGHGPRDAADLTVELSLRLTDRIADVVDNIDDEVEHVQERVPVADPRRLRIEIGQVRQQIVILRRYLAPQREALARLSQIPPFNADASLLARLREAHDRVTRHVEDLDAARERAMLAKEELDGLANETLNKRMYALAVVTGVFLPLGFLTGLLGINVGGIPLADDAWGFVTVVVILAVIVFLEIVLFRVRRWF
ncbi:MAG: zinc transporter ZntB [Gammaproteobacteria bacterium]|nr:zinc transporter ZntB [Gammaproteobacteria bacterium]